MRKRYRFCKKQEGTVLIKVGVQIWRYNLILARSTPFPYGGRGGLTPPFSNYINAEVRWLWMAMKISLAFSKLVLDVKVKFLLISRHFLVVFWLRPLPRPAHFCYIQGIQLVRIWAKFHLSLICSFEISNVFIPAEGIILGCFWAVFWM